MTASPTTLIARTPEDVLAMVPVVLGFVPHESVAMLTFGAHRTFHARVDLPATPDDLPEVVSALLGPARSHLVRQVLFVVYTGDDGLGRTVGRVLAREFERAGVEVVDVLRADGHRWYAPLGGHAVPEWGVPYDVSAHPFLAQAILEGRVTHGSREELRMLLSSEPDRVGRVVAALAELSGDPPPLAAERAWARRLVGRHVGAGTPPDDREVARLLRGLLAPGVRDAACSGLDRSAAAGHVRFWSEVVRCCPGPLLAAPAAVLGLAAWQAGEGALAWCALDRCAEADEDNELAALVAHALTHAVPPGSWRPGPWHPDREEAVDED